MNCRFPLFLKLYINFNCVKGSNWDLLIPPFFDLRIPFNKKDWSPFFNVKHLVIKPNSPYLKELITIKVLVSLLAVCVGIYFVKKAK